MSARDHQVVGTDVYSPATDVSGGRRKEVVVYPTAGYGGVPVSISRPSNTTAYPAGAVVGAASGAVWTFPNMGPAGGRVKLTAVDLRIDLASLITGMSTYRLHLYNASPPSALADGAAWDLPAGDRAAYLGYADIAQPSDLGSTLWSQNEVADRYPKLADGSTALYGYLVTNGGYTPQSGTGYSMTPVSIAL